MVMLKIQTCYIFDAQNVYYKNSKNNTDTINFIGKIPLTLLKEKLNRPYYKNRIKIKLQFTCHYTKEKFLKYSTK
jgi:hypothetical protein